jgi:hypothetical protein
VGIATLNISFVPNEFTIAVDEDHRETLIDLIKITERQVFKHGAGLDIPHDIVSSGHRHFEYLVRA